ncbi:Enhancer of AKt-1 null [Caenorhabditis elegans]|uniref:Enhancer of AKt-1 null n=1 Tax=Caenorhabditis elegans TaxID=6239 RepID=Q9BL23_CAEEL|nr:Enhancer of AKt-1 null [Caenorhabditis elegans]CCD73907.1 Enhancer of AKt-1 null [Caenorhabditis elegans]|eukprot:NP_497343.1 Enhancer of AKt-1 null [Caenorhabditis elegans]
MGNCLKKRSRRPILDDDSFMINSCLMMKTPKKIVFCRGSIRDIQRLVKELTKLVDDIMKLEFNGKSIQKECTLMSLKVLRLQNEYSRFFYLHNCDPRGFTDKKLQIVNLGYNNFTRIMDAIVKVERELIKDFLPIYNLIKAHRFAIHQLVIEHQEKPFGAGRIRPKRHC